MKKLMSYALIVLLISVFSLGCGKTTEPTQTAPAVSTQNMESAQNAQNTQKPESTQNAENTQSSPNTQQVTPAAKPPEGAEKLGPKLSALYVGMLKNNKYLMKYKMTSNFEGESMEVEATVAVSGENEAVTSVAEGIKTTIIIKGDKTYMINHTEKMIMEMPQNAELEDEMSNELETDGLTYVSSGVEGGLAYEQYSSTEGTEKYYFDGNKLVKIVFEVEGDPFVMEILEMSDKVPDSLFEIPSGYQKTTLPG